MGKYDSPYFNSERYYDPTAGAALAMLARKERSEKQREYNRMKRMRQDYILRELGPDPVSMFAVKYAKQYRELHGRRKSGKPKALADSARNERHIRAYIYCMDKADDDPDLEASLKNLYGLEGRRVKQCFTRTGDLGKLVNAWLDYVDGSEQDG